jgi:hypothetical protein
MFQFQVPEMILNRRLVTRGIRSIHQVLVKWSSSPDSLATWEDLKALWQRFPEAPAWDKQILLEGELLAAWIRRLNQVTAWQERMMESGLAA